MKTQLFFATFVSWLAFSVRAETLAGHVTLPPHCPGPATVMLLDAETHLDSPASPAYPQLPPPTRADGEGGFRFDLPGADWICNGVVIAPGCRPAFFHSVNPAAGLITVELKSADLLHAPPGTILRGCVLNAGRQPIAGAIVRIGGVTRSNLMRWPADDIDAFSVADEHGIFTIFANLPFTAAEGAVEAAGFATGLFENWKPTAEIHELTLVEGASLRGRLLSDGIPIANAVVRLDNFGAESGSDFWHYSTSTDPQGQFLFAHLPTNRTCTLYGTMESLAGGLARRRVAIGANGSTNDLGDVKLNPSYNVDGRIRLSDGKPVPAASRLTLLRRNLANLRDAMDCLAGTNGAFHFAGVPAEPMQLLLRVPHYQLTPRDRLLIAGSSTNLDITGDLTNLLIEMRPEVGK